MISVMQGCSKLVIPVFRESDFVGTLTACGAYIGGEELEAFLIEKSTKLNEQEIEVLIQQVPEGDFQKYRRSRKTFPSDPK